MSENAPQFESIDKSSTKRQATTAWLNAQTAGTPLLCAAVFIVSVVALLLWRLYTQLEAGDSAIWDYVAQSILRGQVPYRDVVEIKTPASSYLSAIAMWLGRAAGVRDVIAVRFMQIVLAGVLSSATFLVAEIYLRHRVAALIGALFPLMSDHFVSWTEGGTQPKLTMILFGMLTLLLIARERPFWAGVCSMLACLCWQPGLLFTGVAVLIFSRYLTTWRDGRALKLVAGATVPLAVTVLYFYSEGAPADFWTWTVAYNFEVYAPEGMRALGETLTHAWTVVARVFKVDALWLPISFAGLLLFTFERLRSTLKIKNALESPDLFKDAILIAPILYLAFCSINLQSGPDLIPLFPFVGIFAGWFIAETPRLLKHFASIGQRPSLCRAIEIVPVVALALILALTLFRALTFKSEEPTVAYQESQLKVISDLVGPDDRVYVHGAVEILVLLNKPNLTPYIMWDHGKAAYIAARKYGGSIDSMVKAMEAEAPKLVAVSRLRHGAEREAMDRWIAEHYDKLPITGYEVFLRKR